MHATNAAPWCVKEDKATEVTSFQYDAALHPVFTCHPRSKVTAVFHGPFLAESSRSSVCFTPPAQLETGTARLGAATAAPGGRVPPSPPTGAGLSSLRPLQAEATEDVPPPKPQGARRGFHFFLLGPSFSVPLTTPQLRGVPMAWRGAHGLEVSGNEL